MLYCTCTGRPLVRFPKERICIFAKGKHMKMTIVGRQMNVYDEMKELIEKKLTKFDKFFGGKGEATVTLSCKHGVKYLEITINAANTLFRSEIGSDSFRESLDAAIEAIEGQIRKNKTKVARRLRSGGLEFPVESFEDAEDDVDEEEGVIIRTKTFPIKPMSPEEAILQMNLLGHQFFVFNDDQTHATCVVYARRDGAYGLIVPE